MPVLVKTAISEAISAHITKMGIEGKPYQPSPEEVKKAENMAENMMRRKEGKEKEQELLDKMIKAISFKLVEFNDWGQSEALRAIGIVIATKIVSGEYSHAGWAQDELRKAGNEMNPYYGGDGTEDIPETPENALRVALYEMLNMGERILKDSEPDSKNLNEKKDNFINNLTSSMTYYADMGIKEVGNKYIKEDLERMLAFSSETK